MTHSSATPSQDRVVITGRGIVSAIGCDCATVADNLFAGRGGLGPITGFDVGVNTVTYGAEVEPTALDHQKGKLRRADRTVRFAVESGRQALAEAGWGPELEPPPAGMASLWGCGCGPAGTLDAAHARFGVKGPKGMRPSTVPNCMANSISATVSIQFGLSGTNQVVVSACTSSTNAIGQGFRLIRHGYADVVLCGGVDAFFDPFYYGVWNNLGVLSTLPDAATALRPFDRDRAGTLLGEGGAALVLESARHAEARGATTHGEILGYGESSDASHITSPDTVGQVRAIERALADAQVEVGDIAYINAHGTGTLANDVTESQSIRSTFGSQAERIPVGATKSYFGHTLGASGALESIATLLALEAGRIPPNLNLDHPDPECTVHLAGSDAAPLAGEVAIKNSFGFGGGNAVLVLRR